MSKNAWFWACLGLLLCTLAWVVFGYGLDIVYAYRGQSPISWVYETTHPEWFVRSFPDLTESYGSSLAMYPYLWAYHFLGVEPESFYLVFLAGEIFALALASWFLSESLFPNSTAAARLFFICLVICSSARDINLARFGQPVFYGIYYNFADAFRYAGVAFFIRGQRMLAYSSMAVAFMCHPVIGLIGFGFITVGEFFGNKTTRARFAWREVLCFGAICGVWTWFQVGTSALSSGSIPAERWFALTRFCSYHWYIWDMKQLTNGYTEQLLPFLSFCMLFFYYLFRTPLRQELDRKIVWGCLGLLALVPIGVLAAQFEWNPTIVKLALHRSNDLVVAVGLAYIAIGLWEEIQLGPFWRKILAAGLAVSPFLFATPFPFLLSFVFVMPRLSLHPRKQKEFYLSCFVAVIFLLLLLYFFSGISLRLDSTAYIGSPLFLIVIGSAALLAFLISRMVFLAKPILRISLSIAVFLAPIPWFQNYHANRPFVGSFYPLAIHYKDAQLWARANTDQNALFMTDPTIFYGWKDFSRRSSFGNLRDWLFESWSYNSNFETYQEGMKRFSEFQIELDPYLKFEPALGGSHQLILDVEKKYYEFDDSWRKQMAEKYGIHYFIYRKSKFLNNTTLHFAYENEEFVILKI